MKPDLWENGFPSFKLKFYACNLSKLSILFIDYISRDLDNPKIDYKLFVRYLVVKLTHV